MAKGPPANATFRPFRFTRASVESSCWAIIDFLVNWLIADKFRAGEGPRARALHRKGQTFENPAGGPLARPDSRFEIRD